MRRKIVAATMVFGMSASGSSAEDRRSAWIAVNQSDDAIALQVFAALDAGETAQFQLTSRKSGQSGSAVSQQSGQIGSGDGTAAGPFSTSSFSLRGGEVLEAELVVTTSSGRTLVDKISTVGE